MAKFLVNKGISYEPPGGPTVMHWPGEIVDLSDWPDLERLQEAGTITPVDQQSTAPKFPTPEQVRSRIRRPAVTESEDQ